MVVVVLLFTCYIQIHTAYALLLTLKLNTEEENTTHTYIDEDLQSQEIGASLSRSGRTYGSFGPCGHALSCST